MNDADIYLMIKNKHTDYFCAIQSLKLAFEHCDNLLNYDIYLLKISQTIQQKKQYFASLIILF